MPRRRTSFIILIAISMLLAGCYGDPGGVNGPEVRADFATQVLLYRPAPGQGLIGAGDPTAALGAPDGSVVTLGGFGGSLILRLARPIIDRPGAADFVIWGNAFYVEGDPRSRWAEPGLIEVSPDGSVWYLIGGSIFHTANPPRSNRLIITYSNTNSVHWPAWAAERQMLSMTNCTPGGAFFSRLRATDGAFTNSAGDTAEDLYGFADLTPTGFPASGAWTADDPFSFGVSGSGGDAIFLEWAVNDDGVDIYEDIRFLEFRYVRITTAVHTNFGLLGECSTEVDAVGVCP